MCEEQGWLGQEPVATRIGGVQPTNLFCLCVVGRTEERESGSCTAVTREYVGATICKGRPATLHNALLLLRLGPSAHKYIRHTTLR